MDGGYSGADRASDTAVFAAPSAVASAGAPRERSESVAAPRSRDRARRRRDVGSASGSGRRLELRCVWDLRSRCVSPRCVRC